MKVSELREILDKAKPNTEVTVRLDDVEPLIDVVEVERPIVLVLEN